MRAEEKRRGRGKKQQVQLEGRKVQLYAAFLAALELSITFITTSARRIHRSGPGSRALPALSMAREETTRAVPARGETKDDDALEQPVVITG